MSNAEPQKSTGRFANLFVDRQGLDRLSRQECDDLLRTTDVGRVGFADDDGIMILPVNFVFAGSSILIRTAPGAKLAAAERQRAVAFEIDGWSSERRSGWSVLIRGKIFEVTEEAYRSICEEFDLEPWADHITREHWLRIEIETISGRSIFRAPTRT